MGPRARRVLWMLVRLGIAFVPFVIFQVFEPVATEGRLRPIGMVVMIIRMVARMTLLIALFHRDIRLLGRFLGPSKGACRSTMFVAGMIGLEILALIVIVAFAMICGIGPGPHAAPGSDFILTNFVRPILEIWQPEKATNVLTNALVASGAASMGFVLVPIVEEIIFRGILLLLFLRLIGRWPAVILTSIIFAGLHQIGLDGINWLMFSHHTVAGLAYCLVLLHTHRLRWCILQHAAWNTGVYIVILLILAYLFPSVSLG